MRGKGKFLQAPLADRIRAWFIEISEPLWHSRLEEFPYSAYIRDDVRIESGQIVSRNSSWGQFAHISWRAPASYTMEHVSVCSFVCLCTGCVFTYVLYTRRRLHLTSSSSFHFQYRNSRFSIPDVLFSSVPPHPSRRHRASPNIKAIDHYYGWPSSLKNITGPRKSFVYIKQQKKNIIFWPFQLRQGIEMWGKISPLLDFLLTGFWAWQINIETFIR